jgi:hypothetical protein
MVPLLSLWPPILVSAVLVFIASSVIHMVLAYHRSDYRQVPSETEVMEALRKFGIPPGDYIVPHPGGPEGMNSPAFKEKIMRGPVLVATVMKNGQRDMGAQLTQWFIYCLVVGVLAAYVTSRAVGPGTEYLVVFRFAGCTAFIAYGVALWQNSIWYKRAWWTTFKSNIDALIYGLLTGGTFGWLWPQ